MGTTLQSALSLHLTPAQEAELHALRVGKAPALIAALDELIDGAKKLRDEVTAEPGRGIGLQYTLLRCPYDRLETVMADFQNGSLNQVQADATPTHVGTASEGERTT